MNAHKTPWLAMARNNAGAKATLYTSVQILPSEVFTAARRGPFS